MSKRYSRMMHKDREEEIAFQRRCARAGLSVSAYMRRLADLTPLAESKDTPAWKAPVVQKIRLTNTTVRP